MQTLDGATIENLVNKAPIQHICKCAVFATLCRAVRGISLTAVLLVYKQHLFSRSVFDS